MREYQMLVSLDFKTYYDALLSHTYNPTEETQKELDRCEAANTAYLKEVQESLQDEFVTLYGRDMYLFVSGLMKSEYFLAGKSNPFYLEWIVGYNDNDDYLTIRFRKGAFDLVLDICGGYGGTQTIEVNISRDRIKELLNNKP